MTTPPSKPGIAPGFATRRLRIAYLTAMGLIGALALVWFLRIDQVLNNQNEIDTVISQLMDQRLRTETLTETALSWKASAGGPDEALWREMMCRASNDWMENHRAIEETLRLTAGEAESHSHVVLRSTSGPVSAIGAWCGASVGEGGQPGDRPRDLAKLFENTTAYTSSLVSLSDQYFIASRRLTSQVRREEAALFGAVLFVILLVSLGVFEPTRRRLEQVAAQLHLEKNRAEEASRAKSEFLANMSHEIRTPMNAILGFSESLADAGKDDAEKHRELAIIRRNGQHLLELIKGILDMAKLDSDRIELERADVRIREELDDVIELMAPEASRKGLAFEAHIDPSLPSVVRTDPTRVKQVLLNLLSNAVKFTEFGEVTIRASAVSTSAGTALRFDVSDTGIGMDPEQLNEIFEPFRQADSSITRRFGGTGLGLTITHRLVELFGGELEVISEIGRGSTFTVTLPVEVHEQNESLRVPAPDAPSFEHAAEAIDGASVLIVEDGPDNARLLRVFLEKEGATVRVAANGIEALRTCEGQAYDLIFMDKHMPEMDGLEATRRLRAAGWTRPIVALTAHASDEDRRACLVAGCDDYMTKPISRESVRRMCEKHIGSLASTRAA